MIFGTTHICLPFMIVLHNISEVCRGNKKSAFQTQDSFKLYI